MKKFFYNIWAKFLTWFGQVKVFTSGLIPVFAYDPDPFVVDGNDILQIMEVIQPGDVLIRGFNKYLDGKFIPDERGYSHAGLYVGNNEVIHSAAPCVQKIHIIDFCEADRVMVLRPLEGQKEAVDLANEKLKVPYDFDYKTDEKKLYCFELIAVCYPRANIQTYKIKKFFGLIKRNCYIAKSIYLNPYFKQIFEKNEKA